MALLNPQFHLICPYLPFEWEPERLREQSPVPITIGSALVQNSDFLFPVFQAVSLRLKGAIFFYGSICTRLGDGYGNGYFFWAFEFEKDADWSKRRSQVKSKDWLIILLRIKFLKALKSKHFRKCITGS